MIFFKALKYFSDGIFIVILGIVLNENNYMCKFRTITLMDQKIYT